MFQLFTQSFLTHLGFLLLLGPTARVLVSLKLVKIDSSLKLTSFFFKSHSSLHLRLLAFFISLVVGCNRAASLNVLWPFRGL